MLALLPLRLVDRVWIWTSQFQSPIYVFIAFTSVKFVLNILPKKALFL